MEYKSIGLEWLLSSKNENGYTEKERELKVKNSSVKYYKDVFGSHRFIYFLDNEPVSGLHVMEESGFFTVANVYTKPRHRRKSFAKTIFNEAKEKLKTKIIHHSRNLSSEGKIFAKKVN